VKNFNFFWLTFANPRARVLIGHQNSNPRILLMYRVYSIVRRGFIIAKRGQVSSIKNHGPRNFLECKNVILVGI